MRPSKRQITCAPIDALAEAVRLGCGAPPGSSTPQVEYLLSYLSGAPRARSIVVESAYVDRHYLEEYSSYYASALRSGGPLATRIHVFSTSIDDAALATWIRDAASDPASYAEIQVRLNEAYLGFIVVRPVPSAPIGRTILRPYLDNPARACIPGEGGHDVHLLGLSLMARGLPFQQQDQAVGACATTALWSALARVTRLDGGRAPTPYAVTEAATQHYLEDRVLPAVGGLELAQLTAAVRGLGYSPYVLRPSRAHDTFALSLKCYLRTGIPAIVIVEEAGGYHAITVSGYRIGDDEEPAPDLEARVSGHPHGLLSRGMSRIYVHDDRYGPYVRMRFVSARDGDDLLIERVGPAAGDPAAGSGGVVCYAVLPLYPKLRLSARELIGIAVDLRSAVWSLLSAGERKNLRIELFFMHSGKYQAQIMKSGFDDPCRVEEFVRTVALPRYVGVIRYQLDDEVLLDVLCDTTDIARDCPRRSAVLAVLPVASAHIGSLRGLFDSVGASWVVVC